MDNMDKFLQWIDRIFDEKINFKEEQLEPKKGLITFEYKLSIKFLSTMAFLFLFVTSMLFIINISFEYILRLLIPLSLLIGAILAITKTKKIKIDDKNIEIISPFFKKSFSISTISEIWIDNSGIVTFVSGNWLTMSVGSLSTLYFTGFYEYINKFAKEKKLHIRSMPIVTHGMRLFTLISVLIVCGVILGILYATMVSLPFLSKKQSSLDGIKLTEGIVKSINKENSNEKTLSSDLKYKIVAYENKNSLVTYNGKKMMFKFGILFTILYLVPLLIISYFMIKLPFEKGESILNYYSLFDKIYFANLIPKNNQIDEQDKIYENNENDEVIDLKNVVEIDESIQ
jgi:hypothetical protein